MKLSNSILSTLEIDSSEFFYSNKVPLFKNDIDEEPFGRVTFNDGHYHLTVGDFSSFETLKNLK
jgi:hypothetical protein